MNLSRSESRRSRRQNAMASHLDLWFEYDPSATLVAQEVVDQLEKLSPLMREIVVARVWGDLNFQQIADLVDHSVATVFRHYKHALKQLSETLVPETKPPTTSSPKAVAHKP